MFADAKIGWGVYILFSTHNAGEYTVDINNNIIHIFFILTPFCLYAII